MEELQNIHSFLAQAQSANSNPHLDIRDRDKLPLVKEFRLRSTITTDDIVVDDRVAEWGEFGQAARNTILQSLKILPHSTKVNDSN